MAVPSELVPSPPEFKIVKAFAPAQQSSQAGYVTFLQSSVCCFINPEFISSFREGLTWRRRQFIRRYWIPARTLQGGQSQTIHVACVTQGASMEGSMRTNGLPCLDFHGSRCDCWPQVYLAPLKIDPQKPWPMSSWNSKLLRGTFLEKAHPCPLLLIYPVIFSRVMLGKWKQELTWLYYTLLDLWSSEFPTSKPKQCLRFLSFSFYMSLNFDYKSLTL